MNDEMMDKVDALVARHVIGYGDRVKQYGNGRWVIGDAFPVAVRQYTRDWAAMGEVLTKMRDRIIWVGPCHDEIEAWKCKYERDGNRYVIYADTMQMAVSLAALKAVGVDVREFEEVE